MDLAPPVPISPDHETGSFASGKEPLDHWLKARALTSEGRSARTYVVCTGRRVVGYYCIATGSVRLEEVPRAIRGDMPSSVPVILLGRLAVDAGYQGRGIGRGLLRDALLRALHLSQSVGCRAVVVHALDEDAAAFYAGFGFIAFPAGGLTFFMPIKSIAAAL